MRRLLIISLVLCITIIGLAQVPQNINFQTVYHETEGTYLPNETVKLIVDILEGDASGDIVYREEHTVTSNDFGLINIKIGTGTVLYGSWNNILWSQADQYLMLELDASGTGNSFVDMGVAQLLSVPYALYAAETASNDMWQNNDLGIHYLDGKVGIGIINPSEDLELDSDLNALFSSNMTSLENNALIKILMAADTARPNIQWRSLQTNEFGASMSVREFSTQPLTARSNYIISTADASFSRRPRIKVKYDAEIAEIKLVDCNLHVEGNFISGNSSQAPVNSFWANQWIHGGNVFGIGDKNWETDGIYPGAAAEFYSNGTGTEILLNAVSDDRYSQLKFRRGNAEWMFRNDSTFSIKRNDNKRFRILRNGNVKIGSSDPQYKLDVYGNINIPVGYSYLVGGGKGGGKYAEYFEIEEPMKQGDLAGINIQTGLVKKYEKGDVFIGIVCNASGFIANSTKEISESSQYALVGIEGLVEFQSEQARVANNQVFTDDGQLIGSLIGQQVLLH